MKVIDSSCWISYFTEHATARSVEKHLEKMNEVIVPTTVIYEVHRHLTRKIGEDEAVGFTSQMENGFVLPFDANAAIQAAKVSLQFKLGMADSVIYATALLNEATLVTLDNDFRGLAHCLVLE